MTDFFLSDDDILWQQIETSLRAAYPDRYRGYSRSGEDVTYAGISTEEAAAVVDPLMAKQTEIVLDRKREQGLVNLTQYEGQVSADLYDAAQAAIKIAVSEASINQILTRVEALV